MNDLELVRQIEELRAEIERLKTHDVPGGVDPNGHDHSKLVASDGSPDPALSADAAGDLTAVGNLVLGDTDKGIIEAIWSDFPLIDSVNASGVASHFRDNDGSYPAGWTEVDAAQTAETNGKYSFWGLWGTSTETSWEYKIQTSINIESTPSDQSNSFIFGPILLRDGRFSADVNYFLGMYRDNSGIDTATFSRVHIYWDSAGSIDGTPGWFIRGEEKDGSTQHNGSWYRIDSAPLRPFYVRFFVTNNAAKSTRQYWGGYDNDPSLHQVLQIQNPSSAPTWGQCWIRISQSRGAGITDIIRIGALDYSTAAA